ncbi:MAG: hypothetical protein LBC42_03980, partial [Puniceicoccales bacterium]|nr:hypothetical protein [Puniceicoccales bacterium]
TKEKKVKSYGTRFASLSNCDETPLPQSERFSSIKQPSVKENVLSPKSKTSPFFAFFTISLIPLSAFFFQGIEISLAAANGGQIRKTKAKYQKYRPIACYHTGKKNGVQAKIKLA